MKRLIGWIFLGGIMTGLVWLGLDLAVGIVGWWEVGQAAFWGGIAVAFCVVIIIAVRMTKPPKGPCACCGGSGLIFDRPCDACNPRSIHYQGKGRP